MRRFVASVAIVMAMCACANAQSLGTFSYNFTSSTVNPTASITSTDTTNYNVNAATAAYGSSVTPVANTSGTGGIKASSWTNSTTPSALYSYTFSFTTANTLNFSLNSLTFNHTATSNKGPTQFQLGYSLGAGNTTYTTLAGPTAIIPSNYADQNLAFTFSDAGLNNISSGTTINFILYGFTSNDSGNNTNFSVFSNSAAAAPDAIVMPFYAPVPEPTSMIALSCVGLTALGFRFRRKKAAVAQ